MSSDQDRRREEFLRQAFQQLQNAINLGYSIETVSFSMTAKKDGEIHPLMIEFDYTEVNDGDSGRQAGEGA